MRQPRPHLFDTATHTWVLHGVLGSRNVRNRFAHGGKLILSTAPVQGLGTLGDSAPAKITDTDLERLRGLKQLQVLELSGTTITDAGLEYLKGLMQLQSLELRETKITDAGLEHLKGVAQLRGLDLSGTKITDAGLKHLKGLTQLGWLNLSGTKVTDTGVEDLKKMLPKVEISH